MKLDVALIIISSVTLFVVVIFYIVVNQKIKQSVKIII